MDQATVDAVDWREYEHGEHTFRRKELSTEAATDREGDPDLGCSLYEIPPGKRSWPYHYHTGNAEAAYVLAGEGVVRTEDGEDPVGPGDYLAFPADETGAHQLVNDGEEPLRVLLVSTMNEPDVAVYPEMNKVGVYAGSPPGGRSGRDVSGFWDRDDTVGYWED